MIGRPGQVAAALLLLLAVAAGQQQRVLVLLDDPALEQSHAGFLGGLKARGYAVTTKAISNSALQLKSWDDWLFDKLVVFGSGKGE